MRDVRRHKRGLPRAPKIPIYPGEQFGELTAIRRIPKDANHTTRWLCKCSCGKEIAVISPSLRNGNTGSCGCKTAFWRSHKHGMSDTGLYNSWCAMINRCTDPKSHGYHNYGGRGITICERWLDFSKFVIDMAPRPEGHSLERKNNEGNYCPENCTWATPKQQANNRRPPKKKLNTQRITI